ncbi:MAG: phospho-N-acetylmuramoyl-pentapeptide-transferase [Saprospiraceae bacterium]
MLYYLFQFIERVFHFPGSRLMGYISFRASMAIIVSLIVTMVYGNRIINALKKLQIGESIRDLGLQGQKEKEGTPTMGGLIIILGIILPTVLFTRLDNIYIQLLLFTTCWMGAIGFADDYIKVFLKNKAGLKAIFKIVGQVILGLVVGFVMLYHEHVVVRIPKEIALKNNYKIEQTINLNDIANNKTVEYAYVKTALTNVPFLKGNSFDYVWLTKFLGDNGPSLLWILFIPIVIIIVTAVSNAANLTDGLDGLATGVSAIIAATLAILAYVSGNSIFAEYLNIYYLPYSSELVVFSAALMGSCVGFLWFNTYPAKVFMGDTGSLTLGAIIAVLAIVLRKELLIPVMCGVFFMETLSVMIQVSYFKYTKKKYGEGKRIFLMSPLHHHFQKLGYHESTIATRFWIVSLFLAIITIVTLKIR